MSEERGGRWLVASGLFCAGVEIDSLSIRSFPSLLRGVVGVETLPYGVVSRRSDLGWFVAGIGLE